MGARNQQRPDDRPARPFTTSPSPIGDPRIRRCEEHGAYLYPGELCMGCVADTSATEGER